LFGLLEALTPTPQEIPFPSEGRAWIFSGTAHFTLFYFDWLLGVVCETNSFNIHQTHYEKSNWLRAFNQFIIASELDMINAISATDIAFIMSSSMSAWLLSPLECSPQKKNGWTLRFCLWGWIMWKMFYKTIIEFGFRMISWIIKTFCLCYLITQTSVLIIHDIMLNLIQ